MENLPTPHEAKASVLSNLNDLNQKGHLDELETILTSEVQLVADMDENLPKQYKRMMILTKRAAELVGPVTACKQGCDHCCKMAVTISSYEAFLIGEAIGIKPKKVNSNLDQAAMVKKYINVPCVFLQDHQCSIYDHRPQPCQTHFNLSKFPQMCDTINHPKSEVANVDFRPLWALNSLISYQYCEYNDIREFFPQGLSVVASL